MDIIGDVRRGWAALGYDVRRRIWVVMIISFVTQVAMLFYPPTGSRTASARKRRTWPRSTT